jgi:type I restriction enzyme, S subunit
MNKQKLPEGWKEVELGEVADFLRGPFGSAIKKSVCVVKGQDTYKVYEQGNVIKNDFNRGEYYLNKERFEKLKKFELLSNDIAITCAGTLGKIAIVPENIERGVINSVLMRIRVDSSKISNKYFIYLFRSSIIQDYISSQSQGAALKNLFATKILRKIQIMLPPLETQKKIVSLLEKAEKSKEWRKEADDLTKDFLESVFLGMFGDPIKNSNHFDILKLKEVCEKITDGTHHSPPNSETGEVPYITAKNIKKEGIKLNNLTFISRKIHEEIYKRCNPEKGDVLYIKDGVTTGIAVVNKFDYEFSMLSSVALLKMKDLINPHYLSFLLNTDQMYSKIRESMGGAAITRLTLVKIKEIEIPLPPIELQNKFASIVKEVESMKEQQKHSKNQIDNLFNALMQKAFKGELKC